MSPILIVDDDPSIRTMFARALEALGPIETAGGGGEAVRLLATRKYSVVLLDLHMPVIDGFVVLHTLATKSGPNRDTPIYVISADTSEQARVKALRHRALFMLTKPVPIMTLVGLVTSTLNREKQSLTSGPGVPPPSTRLPMPSGLDLLSPSSGRVAGTKKPG